MITEGRELKSMANLLEPHWDEVDRIVENELGGYFNMKQYKYFRATNFKLKALWYLKGNVENLESQYRDFLRERLRQGCLDEFSLGGGGLLTYYPFFLALEFENLLTQAKACLDCFSKSAGTIFGDSPSKLSKLEVVLDQRKCCKDTEKAELADEILRHVKANRSFLNGTVLDPGTGNKSIRDLISHYQEVPVHFEIRGANTISHALVRFDGAPIIHLPNYRVVWISKQVWLQCRNIVLKSYRAIRNFKRRQQ